jgi:hypothetical protein
MAAREIWRSVAIRTSIYFMVVLGIGSSFNKRRKSASRGLDASKRQQCVARKKLSGV